MSQIVFITGSTDGIGKLTARKLATAGHQVILHGRNADKLSTVVNDIKRDSGNDNVSGYIADLSDLSAVKQLAAKVLTDHPRIDVLINNAGVYMARQPRTAAGLDVRFLVNYLAPVVLTEALLPALRAATAPRVVSLSSGTPPCLSSTPTSPLLPSTRAPCSTPRWSGRHSAVTTHLQIRERTSWSSWLPPHLTPTSRGTTSTTTGAVTAPRTPTRPTPGGYGPAHPDATDAQEIEALIAVTEQLTA